MTYFIKLFIFSTLLLFSVSCSSQSNRPFLEKQLSNSPKSKGPEPEYSQKTYWAALPSKPNLSQQVPKGLNEASSPKKVSLIKVP